MTTINDSNSSNENQPRITPSQLDAWRRMTEDELETAKRNSHDEAVDTILNQLIFIARYNQEISKCWGKINAAMVERTQAEALTTPPEPPAPDLETRLTSGRPEDRTITRDELADAIALAAAGKVQPIEGHDFVRMPAPPAPKLSKAQREALEFVAERQESGRGVHPANKTGWTKYSAVIPQKTGDTLCKLGLLTYNAATVGYRLTESGKTALKGAK